ncbi:hypothetical protein [Dyella japonica]|uniref:Uncharacterized protein n=1 Tax=Dyella japonica A8 TaxID=1217721 RepID=A0A075JUI4_9GAMM|nr:hypothetical protein [Dyella japonica]AIF45776.1 hypothetical protein HY57_00110 [Dyella japonica A8]
MPAPDNARRGHVVLRVLLIAVALGVLVASAVMWWWVRQADDGGLATGQATTSAGMEASSS